MSEPVHHYELHGYVMEDGSVKPSPFEGWVTWAQIVGAARNAKYAVVRKLPIRNHQGKIIVANRPDGPFLVLSLSLTARLRQWDVGALPEPTWTAPNADAAIMKAVMCGKR